MDDGNIVTARTTGRLARLGHESGQGRYRVEFLADSMTEEYLFYDPVTFMKQIGPDRPQSLSSSSPELLALRFAG